jgi:Retinal pigment epithelial membrane protein
MADSQSSRAHPTGLFEPVRSEDDFDLKVVGRIPDALAGAYYRNGPNPQFDPQGPYFPFLGDGMIHAFFLEPKMAGAHAFATAGFAHRNGMRRIRRDACSFTALAHPLETSHQRILPPPPSIRARISTSSSMPVS